MRCNIIDQTNYSVTHFLMGDPRPGEGYSDVIIRVARGKKTAWCALVSLDLMRYVYTARFELLGLVARRPQLRAGL